MSELRTASCHFQWPARSRILVASEMRRVPRRHVGTSAPSHIASPRMAVSPLKVTLQCGDVFFQLLNETSLSVPNHSHSRTPRENYPSSWKGWGLASRAGRPVPTIVSVERGDGSLKKKKLKSC